MPRRLTDSSSGWETTLSAMRTIRPYLLPALGVTFATLAGLVVFQSADRWLTQHKRFVFRKPELGTPLSPDLRITGLNRTPARKVRSVFGGDEGRSVFLMPIAARRDRLLELEWVRDASVSRLWPNRVEVRITERTPVAFVHLQPARPDDATTAMLIDEQGVLLPVEERRHYSLPVLAGILVSHDRQQRWERVRLMQRLLDELGDLAKPVSEIDLKDPGNLRVVYPAEGRAVTLILGGDEWRARMEKFLRHYPEIRRKMPGAIELDLRIKDRIIATEVDKEADGE